MNKLETIMEDDQVRMLLDYVIEDGEIGSAAYPLRDRILELGVVKKCRDSLILLVVAHWLYRIELNWFRHLDGELYSLMRIADILETPTTITVFGDRPMDTKYPSTLWQVDGHVVMGNVWRSHSLYTPYEKSGGITLKIPAKYLLNKLRSQTPMKPVPVE